MVKILSTASVLAVLTLCAGHLVAQHSAPQRVSVTVVMVDRPAHPDAPFTVHRRPDLTPQDMIVLRSDATSDQLSDAVRGLLTARQAGGDSAAAPATMRIRPNSPASTGATRAAASRPMLPWAPRVLATSEGRNTARCLGSGRCALSKSGFPGRGGLRGGCSFARGGGSWRSGPNGVPRADSRCWPCPRVLLRASLILRRFAQSLPHVE